MRKFKLKTFHYEAAFVAVFLAVPFLFRDFAWSELVVACAVFFTFKHAQVADRMQERQAQRSVPDVPCYPLSNRYFMIKEALWITFFIMIRSWSALSGAIVFFCYPFWRKWYRSRYPIGRHEQDSHV